MCGIAGIITAKGEVSLRALEAMERAMVHRGPDDGGIYLSKDKRAGLVNRRLAVIDLSSAGHQPMCNEDGSIWVAYNGEIYNYQEIGDRLKVSGHRFRSNSDTEVIIHGYEEWGIKGLLNRLRGMYAFAIYDSRLPTHDSSTLHSMPYAPCSPRGMRSLFHWGSRLILARDRLGIKPLYYAKTGDTLLFASELKALMASGYLSKEISPAAVVAYLMMGSVPCPLTIYQDVKALEPGSFIVWENGGFSIHKYWDLPAEIGEVSNKEEAIERTRELLLDSVKQRMISDVPLGAFLSGGLDSSSVVALMRKVSNGTIRTCSMVFEEKEYSEASYARAVAEAFGTEHYEKVVTLRDLKAEWDKIIWAMDQPTIDGVNTYFVSKTAKEAGLTVALSGLGGDELFGGYPNTFHGIPRLLKLLKMASRIPGGPGLAGWAVSRFSRNSKFNKLSDAFSRPPTPASAYLVMRGLFSPGEVKSMVSPEIWNEATKSFNPLSHISKRAGVSSDTCPLSSDNFFNWVSRAELRTYTHHQLLRDTDAMSMAHSLEVRVPLLDHVLVDFVVGLDEKFKKNGNLPKQLLIHAVGEDLPQWVRERRDKQGFTFPFAMWLKKGRGYDSGFSEGNAISQERQG